ncbi:MAG TPA: hypothetical protein VJN43_15090 [Bryobacteraceae bacterium]|nr:hypothetical protein [Bryobacteraceae bacterium]
MTLLAKGFIALSIAGAIPVWPQSTSKSSVRFVGTTAIKSGPQKSSPQAQVQQGPEVDVLFEIPGVSGNNAPARLPAAAVPTPPGNAIVSGNFFGFGGLTQFLQAVAPTGDPNGFNFQIEPPDQGLAVGHGFVVEAVNNAIVVFDTQGHPIAFEALSLFFQLPPAIVAAPNSALVFGPRITDPRVYFDGATGQFFVTETEIDTDPATGNFVQEAHVFIAVTQTGNPLGPWSVFSLDVSNDGDARFGACPCTGDQPLIGADQNGFYISTNAFNIATLRFRGAQIYAISKNLLETSPSGSITAVRFHDLNEAEGPGFSIQPAFVPPGGAFESANNGTEYFVGSLDFFRTLDNRVAVWALTNTASLNTATPSLALTNVIVGTEVYGRSPATDQMPGPTPFLEFLETPQSPFGTFNNHEELVTAGDDRMQQVMFSQGMLWTALSSVVKPQGPVRSGAAWFILAPSFATGQLGASVFNQGYVSIASAQQNSVMFPSVGVNVAGKAVVAFSVVGENYFPSAAYALLDAQKGAGPIVISAPGVAPDDGFTGYIPFGFRVARWGDYSAATADENGNLWMGNEMIPPSPPLPPGVLAANWGTFITMVAP